MKAGEESDEQNARREKNAVADVVQNVMAHLVAEDKKNLRRGHSRDGGIPNDHALGRAEAGDVGVHLVELGAGVHQEHAALGNILPGALNHSFELGGELRIGVRERRKTEEKRLEHQRLDKDEKDQDGQRAQPGVEPPAARAAPHQCHRKATGEQTARTSATAPPLTASANQEPHPWTDCP